MRESLKSWLRRPFNAMRRGEVLRVGPLSAVWAPLVPYWRRRVQQLEEELSALRQSAGVDSSHQSRANGARRSVVFLHHAYYNFYYLAQALRRRGWDAISVSLEGRDSPNAKYYHGEDVNLFDPDPDIFMANVQAFYATVAQRFHMLHFYGKGHMSFFPASNDYGDDYTTFPWDFLELRQRGLKIGYTVCGCLDGISQSSFARWSDGACNKCVWQNDPQICNDRRNLAWGHKVHLFCDLVATEGDPALDYQQGEKCYREPLTSALDPDFWRPDLAVPEQYRLPRADGELIVFHAVGNFNLRSKKGRNFKGTPAVLDAIERLRADGINVRLEFVSDIPNKELRYVQAQADVVVDQLNFGRYGATAREAMMLGKPTICRIDASEPEGVQPLQSIVECPLVSANEATVYPILKDLLLHPEKRRAIGEASRAYALKWHSAGACAERFEKVCDRVTAGLPAGEWIA